MKRLIIGLGGVLLVCLFIVYFIYLNFNFRLVKTDPVNGSTRTPTSQIVTFYFNKPLAQSSNTANRFSIKPEVPGKFSIDGKKMVFRPGTELLSANTEYTITVSSVTALDGKKLKDFSIKFTAVYVPFNQMSKEQQQIQISNTDVFLDSNTKRNNLIKSLPYQTGGYSVDYMVDGDLFVIRVSDSPVATQKESALNYLSSKGLDTSKEKISFFILRGLE